jgi:hypothetical protein
MMKIHSERIPRSLLRRSLIGTTGFIMYSVSWLFAENTTHSRKKTFFDFSRAMEILG